MSSNNDVIEGLNDAQSNLETAETTQTKEESNINLKEIILKPQKEVQVVVSHN